MAAIAGATSAAFSSGGSVKFDARCRRGPMRRVTMSRARRCRHSSPWRALPAIPRRRRHRTIARQSWLLGCGYRAACLPDCLTDPSGICPPRSSEPEIAGCFQADNPPASGPAQGFGCWPEPRQRTKRLLPWETRSSNSDCVSPNLCCRYCAYKNKKRTICRSRIAILSRRRGYSARRGAQGGVWRTGSASGWPRRSQVTEAKAPSQEPAAANST
jgi:hypothetical protein